jgi:hypothetical protein
VLRRWAPVVVAFVLGPFAVVWTSTLTDPDTGCEGGGEALAVAIVVLLAGGGAAILAATGRSRGRAVVATLIAVAVCVLLAAVLWGALLFAAGARGCFE